MPMGEMAKDQEFPRKWMFGMAMMLKVAYYKKRAKQLLSKAQPLMEIYRKEQMQAYSSLLQTDAQPDSGRDSSVDRRRI